MHVAPLLGKEEEELGAIVLVVAVVTKVFVLVVAVVVLVSLVVDVVWPMRPV